MNNDSTRVRGSVVARRMTGTELFHSAGRQLGFDLLSFWQWVGSHLASSAFRGNLAEYLVKQATGACGNPEAQKNEDIRATWDDCDLFLPDGNGIEVKSSAYLQEWGWERAKYSRPTFGIKPSAAWDKAKGLRAKEASRHANVYVFCLLKEKDPSKIDPMDVDQWTFWVLPTSVLNARCPSQKTIGIATLERIGAERVNYNGLECAIMRAVKQP